MSGQVLKRDGTYQDFDIKKIADAIYKAAVACNGSDYETAMSLAKKVEDLLKIRVGDRVPTVEQIQDAVEYTLIDNRHSQTAKAFILYREKRKTAREKNALIGATIDLFDKYIDESDWSTKENANMQRSVAGLNNFVREEFTKNYWLNEVYPVDVREAHLSGDMHIHDLGGLTLYCCGYSLQSLLLIGIKNHPTIPSSKPAKHFGSILNQIANMATVFQNEIMG